MCGEAHAALSLDEFEFKKLLRLPSVETSNAIMNMQMEKEALQRAIAR